MRSAGGSVALLAFLLVPIGATAGGSSAATTVRTEIFARPPYSGATYYIYERAGRTICTKLSVCNKFNQCDVQYRQGAFRDPEDAEGSDAADTTPPVVIAPASLEKHLCLTRFGLVDRP